MLSVVKRAKLLPATDQGQLKLTIVYANRPGAWQSVLHAPIGLRSQGYEMKGVNKLLGLSVLMLTAMVNAGEAEVIAVDVTRSSDGTYRFDVTVQHADEGWKHYANRWEVLAPDGTVLGTRTLYHPHVDEQPFTRSLSGVVIPPNVSKVTVRAHDLVHGDGGAEIVVEIPQ